MFFFNTYLKLCLSTDHADRSYSFFVVRYEERKKESAGGLYISYVVKARDSESPKPVW